MIDSYFRKSYQEWCVDPLLDLIAARKWNPSIVTAVGLACGIAIMPALALGAVSWAIALLLISGYCDTLDGSLARLLRHTTPKGAVFDIVSDRIVEFCIVMGLFLAAPEARALPSLMMLGSILICVTSFLVVGIFVDNKSHKSFHYSPGIMERSEAFLFFAAMILFPTLFPLLAYSFIVLVTLTAIIRVWEFARDCSSMPQ
ncbi:MAG: CDP-alcohol phosphatidyltransferase family protein [Chlamydiales bacterium]|nr:CDP-alcohol phosphatidyltransferase family protein [Chlamydiales bacterium]